MRARVCDAVYIFAYLRLISFAASTAESMAQGSMPVEAPFAARVGTTTSVGRFPTNASPANGHPPRPERAIKASATGLEGCQDFLSGIFRSAVQVHSQLDLRRALPSRAKKLGDLLRLSHPDRIRQRHRLHTGAFKPFKRFKGHFRAPRLPKRITEGH